MRLNLDRLKKSRRKSNGNWSDEVNIVGGGKIKSQGGKEGGES